MTERIFNNEEIDKMKSKQWRKWRMIWRIKNKMYVVLCLV